MEKELKNIMLVLSTTRQSPMSVEYAVETAMKNRSHIQLLFIVDSKVPDLVFEKMNEMNLLPEGQSAEISETILREYTQRGYSLIEDIEAVLRKQEISYTVFIERGDFADEALRKIRELLPDLVILTRSRGSKISKFLYGSSVDLLVRESPCQIRIVEER